jgi:hypothetical protein
VGAEQRAVLCPVLSHHGEVDDKKTGSTLYPVSLLMQWKADHEGSNGPALAALGPIGKESLTSLLLEVFSPPCQAAPADRRPAGADRQAYLAHRLGVAADRPCDG